MKICMIGVRGHNIDALHGLDESCRAAPNDSMPGCQQSLEVQGRKPERYSDWQQRLDQQWLIAPTDGLAVTRACLPARESADQQGTLLHFP